MSTKRKTWLARSIVAVAAVVGLVAVTTAPATAELPDDQPVVASLEGGSIAVNEVSFPLGAASDLCNPEGAETTISAHVGPIADGVAEIHDQMTAFAPGEVMPIDDTNAICAQIVVTGETGGTQESGDGEGTWTLDTVSNHVEVFGVGPEGEALFPPEDGCTIGSEANPVVLDSLSGPISEDGPPHQATLGASGFEVPPVEAAGNCSADAAGIVNGLLGLDAGPATATALEFVLTVEHDDDHDHEH